MAVSPPGSYPHSSAARPCEPVGPLLGRGVGLVQASGPGPAPLPQTLKPPRARWTRACGVSDVAAALASTGFPLAVSQRTRPGDRQIRPVLVIPLRPCWASTGERPINTSMASATWGYLSVSTITAQACPLRPRAGSGVARLTGPGRIRADVYFILQQRTRRARGSTRPSRRPGPRGRACTVPHARFAMCPRPAAIPTW